jgi:hypothetical protein
MIDLEIEELKNNAIIHLLKMSSGETLIGNFIKYDEEFHEIHYEYMFKVLTDEDKFYFIPYMEISEDDMFYVNPDHIMVRSTPNLNYRDTFIDYLIGIELDIFED